MLYFCRNHQYGQAPSKVIAKVSEWIDLHEAEILTLWERAQRGEYDGTLFEVFGELLDKAKFVQYGLTPVTIEWANGADLAPEFLYGIGNVA